MGAKIISVNNHDVDYNRKEYFLTSVSQVDLLPKKNIKGKLDDREDSSINDECAYGSVAKVIVNGVMKHYILTPDNEWTEYTEGSVGSSDGSGSGSGSGGNASGSDDGFIEL